MGAYLDRLHAEFDECSNGIATILERAVTENRDPSEDEQAILVRSEARRVELEKAIENQTLVEQRTAKVQGLRGNAPTLVRSSVVEKDEPYNILNDIPSAGHYVSLLHRAQVKRDPEAIQILERTAAEQTTADNAGIMPTPIVGPLVDIIRGRRRFLDSIGVRSAPSNKFSRPVVTQHVDLDVQAAELDELTSQKMLISDIDVELATIGGYLNLSKQDVRWSQPGILNILFESFAKVYARRSNSYAAGLFQAGIANTAALDWSDFVADPRGKMDAWLALALADLDEDATPDTLWMDPDVASVLRFERSEGGQRTYNIPLGSEVGDAEGLRVVIDPAFTSGFLALGDSDYVEAYEDLEGFLSVDIPSALGQQIGYAGYIDLIVTEADAFTQAVVSS